MKKLLCLLLALTFVFALCACGGETETPNEETTTTPTGTIGTTEEETTLDDGKVEYVVKVQDEAGAPIAAVDKVQVCDETNMCSIIFLTDGEGSMRLNEAVYHATLMSLPEGYDYTNEETEFSFDSNNVCVITLKAV